MREYIGHIGHLSVIISFVAAVFATVAYFLAAQNEEKDLESSKSWKNFARIAFGIHAFSVFLIVFSLFNIIYNHYYEFHYAWNHSSNHLPVYYMISCFWEGQEGSFLLWIFWHVMLGAILMFTNPKWENRIMTIFLGVQIFLTSMILGVVLGDFKLGSSPFILMKEVMYNAPIFQSNPNFIPEDGTGLNPLLQNYWMVIHPPTLFLGFAFTLIPFAYAIAGFWKKDFTNWVKPALPWTIVGAMVLGVGILMGGYWAYETLNFGGYWNWDPVENAVFVPWLVMIGAIHIMILGKKTSTVIKWSFILTVTTFLLILYSTFLTRSGVLGEASVHSFTDLGLSGQLLVYLLAFVILTIVLAFVRWKNVPGEESTGSMYSKDFWIFIGIAVLGIASFQVIVGTSIPVFNKITAALGFSGKMAPPANQILYYSKFQVWTGALIALCGSIAQYIWWNKFNKENKDQIISKFFMLFVPILIISGVAIFFINKDYDMFTQMTKSMIGAEEDAVKYGLISKLLAYTLLMTSCIFSLVIAVIVLKSVLKQGIKLSGGAITHIGVALMLLGILFSSGYDKVVSINYSGLIYNKEFPAAMNVENVLLWRRESVKMEEYTLKYEEPCYEVLGFSSYIPKSKLLVLFDNHKAIAKTNILHKGQTFYKQGDTLDIVPENTYYKVRYIHNVSKDTFYLYPRAQVNPQMGFLASPDISRNLSRDLYTHVSSVPDPNQPIEWNDTTRIKIGINDTVFFNDYVGIFRGVKQVENVDGIPMKKTDIAIQAYFTIFGKDNEQFVMNPTLLIRNNQGLSGPVFLDDIGMKISFVNIDTEQNKFIFETSSTQLDYIILKAVSKPMINLLWIGTLVLVIGFSLSSVRRYQEFKQNR
ncbi:MAG: cytochrome c biogenesis protein CcsA [Cytophagales bacterium]|nr:cytochrome c biogenesis protein CcsA [Cytophagales bacterium]